MRREDTRNINAFEVEKIVATNRVAKVVKGGRNFSFNAIVVVGDKKGRVGIGSGKANEIVDAIRKAKEKAAKSMFTVPIVKGTIPHEIIGRFGASKILLKPASPGTGIIAGGPARAIFEASGIENILSRSLGSNTKGNVVKATVAGLRDLMTIGQAAAFRGKKVHELTGQKPIEKMIVNEDSSEEIQPNEISTGTQVAPEPINNDNDKDKQKDKTPEDTDEKD